MMMAGKQQQQQQDPAPSATATLRGHHSFLPQTQDASIMSATATNNPSNRQSHTVTLPRSLQRYLPGYSQTEEETVDAELAELQAEIDKMNAEEEQIKKVEGEITDVIAEEMEELEDVDAELLDDEEEEDEEGEEEEEEEGDGENEGGEESGSPDGTKDEQNTQDVQKTEDTHDHANDQDEPYLGILESDLQAAQNACTKAKSAIPRGFELHTETPEEIDAVNEGCCLGTYATDVECKSAIPQVECDVHRVCSEADELAGKLKGWLHNNVDAAEKKCKEGAAGILEENVGQKGQEKAGKEEGPYDNVDDLNIIRMKCCLAPFDADLVECEDEAAVETMRANNRCDMLEWCLEANRMEGQLMDENSSQSSLVDNNMAPSGQNQDDDGYYTSPHVGGRDDGMEHAEEKEKKKTKFDKTKGLDGSRNPFGVAGGDSGGGSSSGSSSSAGMWFGLTIGLTCCVIFILFVSKRKSKQSPKRSSGASGGPKDRRVTRRPMPSHFSHAWEGDDPEYGEHPHSDVGIVEDDDDSSFAPAIAGLFGARELS